jgi:hypothetical protein
VIFECDRVEFFGNQFLFCARCIATSSSAEIATNRTIGILRVATRPVRSAVAVDLAGSTVLSKGLFSCPADYHQAFGCGMSVSRNWVICDDDEKMLEKSQARRTVY